MRKLISLLLSIAMILSMSVMFMTVTASAAWDGAASEPYTGEGTEASPFKIANAAQLKAFADDVNTGKFATDTDADGIFDTFTYIYAELTADIDLGNNEWAPIGNADTIFYGTFDGKNHTVSSFKVVNINYAGFIGVTNGAVKNLTVEKATITLDGVQANSAAIIAAHGKSGGTLTVENCVAGEGSSISVSNAPSANTRAGGIVGNSTDPAVVNVSNCVNYADIALANTTSNHSALGGIVGALRNGSIKNCVNYGDITTSTGTKQTYIGGIVGLTVPVVIESDPTALCDIENCITYGNVLGDGNRVGGIIGNVYDSSKVTATFKNVFSLAERIEFGGKGGLFTGAIAY